MKAYPLYILMINKEVLTKIDLFVSIHIVCGIGSTQWDASQQDREHGSTHNILKLQPLNLKIPGVARN